MLRKYIFQISRQLAVGSNLRFSQSTHPKLDRSHQPLTEAQHKLKGEYAHDRGSEQEQMAWAETKTNVQKEQSYLKKKYINAAASEPMEGPRFKESDQGKEFQHPEKYKAPQREEKEYREGMKNKQVVSDQEHGRSLGSQGNLGGGDVEHAYKAGKSADQASRTYYGSQMESAKDKSPKGIRTELDAQDAASSSNNDMGISTNQARNKHIEKDYANHGGMWTKSDGRSGRGNEFLDQVQGIEKRSQKLAQGQETSYTKQKKRDDGSPMMQDDNPQTKSMPSGQYNSGFSQSQVSGAGLSADLGEGQAVGQKQEYSNRDNKFTHNQERLQSTMNQQDMNTQPMGTSKHGAFGQQQQQQKMGQADSYKGKFVQEEASQKSGEKLQHKFGDAPRREFSTKFAGTAARTQTDGSFGMGQTQSNKVSDGSHGMGSVSTNKFEEKSPDLGKMNAQPKDSSFGLGSDTGKRQSDDTIGLGKSAGNEYMKAQNKTDAGSTMTTTTSENSMSSSSQARNFDKSEGNATEFMKNQRSQVKEKAGFAGSSMMDDVNADVRDQSAKRNQPSGATYGKGTANESEGKGIAARLADAFKNTVYGQQDGNKKDGFGFSGK